MGNYPDQRINRAQNIGPMPKVAQAVPCEGAVKASSNIDAMLCRLSDGILNVEDRIARLIQKLTPVRDTRPVPCGNEGEQTSAATCELSAQIESVASRAYQCAIRLEELMSEVQL